MNTNMDYPHQLPRFLHKAGGSLYVSTVDACVEALKDGWAIDPNVPAVQPEPVELPKTEEPDPSVTVTRPYFKKGKHAR